MKNNKNNPICYRCKYKKDLIGSAHISCHHPSFKNYFKEPIIHLFSFLASVGRLNTPILAVGVNVKGDPHGIFNGWFNHPFDFDPVWLIECDGFEEKK